MDEFKGTNQARDRGPALESARQAVFLGASLDQRLERDPVGVKFIKERRWSEGEAWGWEMGLDRCLLGSLKRAAITSPWPP